MRTIPSTFVYRTLMAVGILFTSCLTTQAQTVSNADSHEIVTKLADKLVEVYPFPEISAQYKEVLLKNDANGSYNGLTEEALAAKITDDLRKTHKDVHLHVMRNVATYKRLTTPPNESKGNANDDSEKKANYGFKRVEIDGTTSTAYIDVPGPFYGSQEAFEMAAASMNMAAYSKYIIIDVRHNPGGTGQMGRFLASYFYDPGNEQYYLNGFYKDRKQDEQEWTYAYTPGKHMPDAKVYILVGRGTGSASEGFAYAMQKLKRATIVGDTTAGAGIAGTFVALKNNLIVFTPFKMVVGPNSNVGWEGTGVIPDVELGKDDALIATRKLILEDMLKNSADSTQKEIAQWLVDDSKIASNAAVNMKSKYGSIIGKYSNNITVTYAKGDLLWNRAEPGKPVESYVMKEVKPDVLVITGLNSYVGPNVSRVYINRDAKGAVAGLTRKSLSGNGSITVNPQLKKI